jgi:hypothetical protein
MRIHEILAIDRKTGEIADLLMRQISNAFTRHGDLKGLLGFGPSGDVPLYHEPAVISPADDDPAAAAISSTGNRPSVPARYQAAEPELTSVKTPNFGANPTDLAGRRR